MTKIKMTKRFYWKEITSDGLLKSPRDVHQGNKSDSINDWLGFETEKLAIKHLKKLDKTYRLNNTYALITVYHPRIK